MGCTLSISSNTSEVAMVAGASSIIFWWRRCTEQSLPNREMALPYWSAKIWTSKWRACFASCMTKIGDPGTSAWTWRTKENVNPYSQQVHNRPYTFNFHTPHLPLSNPLWCSLIFPIPLFYNEFSPEWGFKKNTGFSLEFPLTCLKRLGKSSTELTLRMPFPPPPSEAFTITG